MKVCNNCGKELTDDSLFCQYCGSNDIHDTKDDIIGTPTNKVCKGCNKYIPEDSLFCPFCGGKNVVDLSRKVVKEDNTQEEMLVKESTPINNSIQESSKPLQKDIGVWKGLIIGLICTVLICVVIAFVFNNNSSNSNNLTLQTNEQGYDDFWASKYECSSSDTIKIYYNGDGTIYATPYVSSGNIIVEWGDWYSDEKGNYSPLNITVATATKGTIQITNTTSSTEVIVIEVK